MLALCWERAVRWHGEGSSEVLMDRVPDVVVVQYDWSFENSKQTGP